MINIFKNKYKMWSRNLIINVMLNKKDTFYLFKNIYKLIKDQLLKKITKQNIAKKWIYNSNRYYTCKHSKLVAKEWKMQMW